MVAFSLFTVCVTAAFATALKYPQSIIDCEEPSSIWEKELYCPIAVNEEKYQRNCVPRITFPESATIKGVVLLFHGYSACPDSMQYLSREFVDQGFVTMAPLLPGQGVNFGYNCNASLGLGDGNACAFDFSNPAEIPICKEEYIEWTKLVVDAVNEQVGVIHKVPGVYAPAKGFQVISLGLSVGGVLATLAAQLPRSQFSKVITINPWFVDSPSTSDFALLATGLATKARDVFSLVPQFSGLVDAVASAQNRSLEDDGTFSNSSLQKARDDVTGGLSWTLEEAVLRGYKVSLLSLWEILSGIADNALLRNLNMFEAEVSWGVFCLKQVLAGSGGICTFRLKHFIALQSLAGYTIGNLDRIEPNVTYFNLHSDIDGPTKDSVSFEVARMLNGSRCRFATSCSPADIIKSLQDGNKCGAPHNILSRPSNKIVPPYWLYWEDSLFKSVVDVVTGSSQFIGVNSTSTAVDSSVCVATNSIQGGDAFFENLGPDYVALARKRYRNATLL